MKRHILRFEQASFLVVVMLTAFLMISCIPRNPNTLPVADFKLVESSATEMRQLHFDASTSTDKEDSTDKLITRWDFNGDGVWEIDYSANKKANEVVSHSYNVAGTTTVVVEVKDSKGLTSRREKEIQINLAPPQSLYLESFSDNEIAIVWNDISTSEDSYNVSLNDIPLEQLPANTEEYTFELDTSATQTISVYCAKGTMKSNKTELVMGMNLSESTTVFEEVSVTLPASHVGNTVKVELVEESPELPENSVPLGAVYEIDVEGLTDEATEIPVKISFDTGFEQADEDKALVIMHYDEENELWIPTLTVEDESGRSYTYTKDFSLYTLVLYGETLEVKDFSPGVNGLTFVNYPEVLRNADNHLSDFDTTGNEDGCCFGMTITSLELYNEKLPRDPEFDFDVNKEAILYKLVRFEVETTDGKMEIDLDPFFYKPRVTCEAILEAVFNEHGRQLLTDIEATLEFLVLAPSRISLSITQIDEILYSLVLGRPIEVGIFSLPFLKNAHSIVVYGAEIKPFGIDFAIYDPNYPGVTKTLSVIEPFWIMGDYGKEYDFLLADSLKTVAGSHATRQELEEMLDNAYIPRFKGMYYNINDNSIWMSLWNHYRPDRPTPSSINIMRKENSSYSLLKTIDDKGTTQIHTDVNVEPNKTYTYRIDRIDGGESPEYSIETRVFNVDPVSGSNVSKDGFTISMDLPAGIYRAYKNYSDTQIDHLKSGGNTISFSATECQQYFSNGTVNLKILGVFDSSFVTRDVIYYLTDPPTVTKVSGSNGETSESCSTFTWSGSDPDGTITKYDYRKDEGSWESNGTSTSYTWNGYSEGPHKFEVRAQDNDEQYSETIEWNFTYSAGTIVVGEMVLVEGGTFMMGDELGDLEEWCRPVHQVTLTYDFEIGKYEVTFDEYDAFCEATGRSTPSEYGWGRGTRPVINVSWWDAIAYCNWLSEESGLPVAYKLAGEVNEGQLLDSSGDVTTDITKVVGYRLPTEAEWEYAARGGKYNSPYKYSGSDDVDEVAWYFSNSGDKTQEVGKKAPNELGIYDMSGNAWEWCSDWFDGYSTLEQTNPYNSEERFSRVGRGGGWIDDKIYSRVACRHPYGPCYEFCDLGFRVCRISSSLNQLPVVSIIEGPDGEVSESSSTFTWTGSDSDGTITKYEYRKDGGTWTSNGTSKSYTWSGYSEGNHEFEVRAQDNKGAYSSIIYWYFTYQKENEPPTVTKVSGPSEVVSETSSTFTWTGSDPDGTIAKYEYRKDEGSWVSNGTSTSYTWSVYSIGEHTFEVRAQDDEGDYSNIISWSFTYSTGTVVVGQMVTVEGGTFTMGDTWGDGSSNELPVHQVTLTYDLEVGKYEVTFDEYDAFCSATGRNEPSDSGWGRGSRPVIWVSWWDAIAYCNWLSVKKGLPVAYRLKGEVSEGQLLDSNGNVTTDITKVVGYRLPTEAEWEYTARGGKYNSPYKYSGSDNVADVAWYGSNSESKTHEVGTKAPNDLGIHDMSGNVWEWCSDWYDSGYYAKSPTTNPYNYTPGSSRVCRGGSWFSDATYTWVALRSSGSPTYAGYSLGFRITRTVP